MTRLLHKLTAFLILPVLGYLLGATIFIHFYDQIEPGVPADTGYVAVAKTCERHGPVTMRGFGYWWACQAEVTRLADGAKRTMSTRGFLKPEHIGHQVAVNTTRNDRELVPEERPRQGLGGLLLIAFGILWLFVLAYTSGPLLKKSHTLRRPSPTEPEPDEVYVWGGRKRLLKGAWLWLVLAICGLVAVNFADLALNSRFPLAMTIFFISVAIPVLLIANGVRRFLQAPEITISPEGLTWRKNKLAWHEIHHVHLSTKNVLSIHPNSGDPVHIGKFGDEQATRIHTAITNLNPLPYTREDHVNI